MYEKCKLFPITGAKVVCILDVAGSNLGRDTGYLGLKFVVFLISRQMP
jgi:hypothetical protein